MKHRSQMLFAAGAVMIANAWAEAGYIGLATHIAPTPAGPAPGGPPRAIVHVYAVFTQPTDRVIAWGVGDSFGPGFIRNLMSFGGPPGSGFTNIPPGPGGQLAPYSPGTARDWDTYMTIGVQYGQQAPGGLDPTSMISGTPAFISGNAWEPTAVAGVFITLSDPQGRADYLAPNDRVLLMQLVVNAGEVIHGMIGLYWADGAGNTHFVTHQLIWVQTPPTPGSLALLAVAAIAPRRRRRE